MGQYLETTVSVLKVLAAFEKLGFFVVVYSLMNIHMTDTVLGAQDTG